MPSPATKLMKWILEEKGGCSNPIPLDILFNEYPQCYTAPKSAFIVVMKQKLRTVNRLRDFSFNEKVKLLFLLSFPVNEQFEKMIRDTGAVLELTDPGRFISYYRSAGGSLERGVPPQNNVRIALDEDRDQNGGVAAGISYIILVVRSLEVYFTFLFVLFHFF